ncbi:kinase-like domain-containing protein [Russula emetica]|nr:kinase-like domain-containing protein [Russula emetica]
MTGLFFQDFALHAGGTIIALTGNRPWPFNLITKCETDRVNSKPKQDSPEDLVRMLLSGAAIVRFANKFLNRFMEARNFVLFAIYIWDDGRVTRYSLFQEPNDSQVRCNETVHWLETSDDRAEFVRQLYNLRDMLEKEEEAGDTKAKIQQLQNRINQHHRKYPMKSFHTKDTRNKRKRPDSDVDSAGGGAGGVDATDCAELGAHGYQVEPRDIVDEDGYIMMESFSNTPSHILTVYQRSVPSKKFIAKKVCEQSKELEIFKLLNTLQPKSEHIISLHDSFQTQSTSWAILPEMDSIADYVSSVPHRLYGKVAQVCRGLIKGVVYLHEFCIAHRDIKPENLVVDREFCLKIIDFDIAMRVKDDHKVVDGQCGTKGWMAPEIEEPVVNRASSSLSSEQVKGRKHGSEDDCEETDCT